MGPSLSSRHRATRILCIPEYPVGNRAACHPNKRSFVSGRSLLTVASSKISTVPSAWGFLASGRPAVGRPSRLATDDRTAFGSRSCPSISEVLRASSTRISARACSRISKPRSRMRASRAPCRKRHAPRGLIRASLSQVNAGQFGDCQMYFRI